MFPKIFFKKYLEGQLHILVHYDYDDYIGKTSYPTSLGLAPHGNTSSLNDSGRKHLMKCCAAGLYPEMEDLVVHYH